MTFHMVSFLFWSDGVGGPLFPFLLELLVCADNTLGFALRHLLQFSAQPLWHFVRMILGQTSAVRGFDCLPACSPVMYCFRIAFKVFEGKRCTKFFREEAELFDHLGKGGAVGGIRPTGTIARVDGRANGVTSFAPALLFEMMASLIQGKPVQPRSERPVRAVALRGGKEADTWATSSAAPGSPI